MVLEWLIALSLTLLIIDLFFDSEFLSWTAMLILTSYFTYKIGPELKWGILVFLLILSVIVLLYYTAYRSLIVNTVHKTLLRNAPDETTDRIVGKKLRIRIINGVTMVKWDDELWHVANADTLSLADGDEVIVEAFADGQATVKKC